jgi:cell wall-associated NlpC family hydrolase
MKQLGTPYVFGGATPYVAFDCSGFVQYAFNQNGFNLLHSSELISKMGVAVDKSNLRKGDLVFLQGTYKPGVSHVGIYLGNNQILHAGTMGTREVKISTFFGNSYYDAHYWGARRLIN